METKYCKHCNTELPLASFSKNKSTKDGYSSFCKEYHKKYSVANSDKLKKYYLDRYYADREANLEYRRAYYDSHREEYAKYREDHAEERSANFYDWLQRNPESNRARSLRWRKLSIEGLSKEDVQISACYRKAIKNDLCFYCGKRKARMHNDHYYPVSKGGKDFWWNLFRACQPCNNKKSASCGTYFRLREGLYG